MCVIVIFAIVANIQVGISDVMQETRNFLPTMNGKLAMDGQQKNSSRIFSKRTQGFEISMQRKSVQEGYKNEKIGSVKNDRK